MRSEIRIAHNVESTITFAMDLTRFTFPRPAPFLFLCSLATIILVGADLDEPLSHVSNLIAVEKGKTYCFLEKGAIFSLP